MKLDNEQIYHLIELLEIDSKSEKILLSDKQVKDSIKYNNKIISKLKEELI